MNEEMEITTIPEVEDDAIMPDGYGENDDIFDDTWKGNPNDAASGNDTGDADINDFLSDTDVDLEDEGKTEDPTTDQKSPDSQGDESPELTPTTELKPEDSTPKKIKLRIKEDHEEKDVEIDETELPTLVQKARALERYQAKVAKLDARDSRLQALAKQMEFDSADALIESVVNNLRDAEVEKYTASGVPEDIARDFVERKLGLSPAPSPVNEDTTPRPEEKREESLAPPERDFKNEVAELLKARPDLIGKQLPDEVSLACAKGQRLVDAYASYESRRQKAEAEKLRRENQILKQNAASAARGPVKGTTGGGITDTKPADPFIAGFDSEDW